MIHADTATKGLTNLSALAKHSTLMLDLNELRWLIQYEGIPVFTDGRTRTRYLDEAGVERVKTCAAKFIRGRSKYFQAKVHPAFAGQGGDHD